jgi:hypothetical protein
MELVYFIRLKSCNSSFSFFLLIICQILLIRIFFIFPFRPKKDTEITFEQTPTFRCTLQFDSFDKSEIGSPTCTVAAESFYTCSSKTRLFNVYWRMVSTYDRG